MAKDEERGERRAQFLKTTGRGEATPATIGDVADLAADLRGELAELRELVTAAATSASSSTSSSPAASASRSRRRT